MLTEAEKRRYHRHLILRGFGPEAQERLKAARILVIGAGGLGSPALLYLAAAGVGKLIVIDPDTVDASNLQRQVLYTASDVGVPKAVAAAKRLLALNGDIEVVPVVERFRRDNALDLVRSVDLVLDGSDNFATRYLVNDACVMADKPFVYGAIQGFEGQVSVFNYQGGPTYRCLFPTPPEPDQAPSCADAGVLGVLPGVIGTLQATEAIKVLARVGEPLSGKLFLWSALTMATRTLKLAADPSNRVVASLPDDAAAPACHALEIDAVELRSLLRENRVQLLDVRSEMERQLSAIQPSLHVPLPLLEADAADEELATLRPELPTVVYCAHGIRSLRAVAILREQHGLSNARSLRGGMQAWG